MKDHLPHFSFTHTLSHELIITFQNISLLFQQIDNYKKSPSLIYRLSSTTIIYIYIYILAKNDN